MCGWYPHWAAILTMHLLQSLFSLLFFFVISVFFFLVFVFLQILFKWFVGSLRGFSSIPSAAHLTFEILRAATEWDFRAPPQLSII